MNPAQERLWFLHQAYPHQALFPLLAGYRIVGAAARTCRLLQALSKVQERRDVLRSRFLRIDEEPARMEVLARSSLPATVVDLRSLGADQRVLEAERLERREAEHSLGGGPLDLLWRATVILPEPDELVLLLTLSPAIASRTTLAALVEEVALELEPAIRDGVSPSRSVKAEASPLETPQESLDTYLESLASSPPEPNLPVDWLRPPVQSLCAGEVSLPLARTFPEETLLASFLGFLVRVTDPGRLLRPIRMALGVGTTHAQSETLLPFFLVVEGDPSFASLVADGAAALKRRRGLQGLTFEGMLERLQPPRDPSRAPLFQLGFRIESSLPFPPVPGLEVERFPRPEITTELDLELRSGQAEDVPYLKAVFSRDLFEATTVARLLSSLRVFMEAGHQKPALRLSELPLLSRSEEERLLREWNPPPSSELVGELIHEAFFRQATLTPADVAVTAAGVDVTYEELSRRAILLAEGLQGLGIVGGDTVGVLCGRSPYLIASLLGVLRAGAAYLPLDPAYPEERLRFMLQDSGAKALVTDSPLAERLSGDGKGTAGLPLLGLNGEGFWESAATNTKVWPRPSPDELAYVIYTSGSTGRPKGVAIPHSAATALVTWARGVFSDRELSSVLGATSVCFDLSVFEIFVPLSCGGRIVLVQDLLRLPEEAASQGVTLINTVPSVLGELLQAHTLPETVETVNLAGEPLLAPLVAEAYRQPGVRRVLNLYGPSEDTTYSTWAEIAVREEAPSIGRPVAGSAAYVVDARLRPLPAGVGGELILGGDGLARGYLGRPALTAECFVPNPFSNGRGARLYRTGDRARLRPNEDLQFLGRLDRQVKLRGFRIELGEVEAAVARCPGVNQAAVVVRSGPGGLSELVAYVGASTPEEVKTGDLCRLLQERLPAHMVPATFVVLAELPLTPSGKVDRKALPQASRGATGRQVGREGSRWRTEPRNEVEAVVAGLVGGVLGVTGVDRDDDFLELGGHSLLAARLAAAVRDAFGVALPLGQILSTPRVYALAAAVVALRGGASEDPEVGRPIPLLVDRSHLPLTFGQEQLWLFEEASPGTAAYNVPAGLRLSGALNLAALREALDDVVQRHEILHSRLSVAARGPFSLPEGGGRSPAATGTWPLVDLTALSEDRRRSLRRSLEQLAAARPVDPAAGRPLRAWILRAATEDHDLLLTFHHSAVDGWSLEIFFWELSVFYGAALNGKKAPPLPPLAVQVGDVAGWQRARWTPARREEELGFWRGLLADLPAALELPTDHPRPLLPSYRGLRLPVHLPSELVKDLQSLGHRCGATLFMVLLAGFQALLARLSGQSAVAMGTPYSHRPSKEMEALVGYFISMLVLPARMVPGISFEDLLRQVRGAALDALSHPELPFQDLVEELDVGGDCSRNPLFQALFQLVPASEPARLEGLEVASLERDSGTAKVDLELSLEQRGVEVSGYLEASKDLFDGSTLERWLGHWRCLLETAVAAPETAVRELDLLFPSERWQLLGEWSAAPLSYPRESTVHTLFREQALARPGAPALEFHDAALTYGELEEKANGLAWRLRAAGVGPGDFVAVYLERSAEMVLAMVGCLKAGAAFVPIDLAYPEDRVRFILEEASAAAVLTEEALKGGLPARWREGAVTNLTSVAPRSEPPSASFGGNMAAYVMYTSGSSGRPKGVVVPHRAIVRLVRNTTYVHFRREDRVAQCANPAFDAATFEIWGALVNGGCLVGLRREELLDSALFAARVRERRITTLFLTTAVFNKVAREEPTAFASVSWAYYGGEAADASAVRRVLEHGPPGKLVNCYGPTENTTFTTTFCSDPAAPPEGEIPIGRPLSNTEVYVLDHGVHPVPMGVPGELCIGGDGLAQGYLRRPGRTAESFAPNPFGPTGCRLYRTGDRVRHAPDGNLEYLGRLDFQVKLRGLRIELGEVEVAVRSHPSVSEVVLLLREDEPGDKRLVAYLVPEEKENLSLTLLRSHLLERLPEYMVPSAFVVLDSLPITVNGKVDRGALPKATAGATGRRADFGPEGLRRRTAPRNEVEALVAGLVGEVLGVAHVDRDDDFFELGGHSLLAARLAAAVRDAFGVDLPLGKILSTPRVEALAAVVAELSGGSGEDPESGRPVPVLVDRSRLPLTFAQEQLWLFEQANPGTAAYTVPTGLRLSGPLDLAALWEALEGILRRHEGLRSRIVLDDRGPFCRWADEEGPPPPIWSLVDLTALPESQSESLRFSLERRSAAQPMDLAAGPPVRVRILRVAPEAHDLLVTFHHAAVDGWSLEIFFGELSALYRAALREEEAPTLPPLAVQVGDVAAWQRSRLSPMRREEELGFWRGLLADLPAALELPTDRPRQPLPSYRGLRLPVRLPSEQVMGLQSLGRRRGATLFMVLLGSFQALLARLSSQGSLAVGVPSAYRPRREMEALVGYFVSMLVLPAKMVPSTPFEDLLRQVRGTVLDALSHPELPFQDLVEELSVERDRSRNPLFQVLFQLVPASDPTRLEGLEVMSLDRQSGTAKFDIELTLEQREATVSGYLEVSTDLFDGSTVERWLGHWLCLLEAAVAAPETAVGELELLSPGERCQLLSDWSGRQRLLEGPKVVHAFFEEQARITPFAPAVIVAGADTGEDVGVSEMTYQELEARSGALAAYLRTLGVGPDVAVGLAVERSPLAMVGVLGILRAGGCYVPLDPNYPRQRLENMIGNAGMDVLVTQESLLARLPLAEGVGVVLLDRDLEVMGGAPWARFNLAPAPVCGENLAYVIFTSGSTGRPKGVALSHGALANLVAWQRTDSTPQPSKRTLQFASLSFDVSFQEMFSTWATGGALVLVDEELRRDPVRLLAAMTKAAVDRIFLPFVALESLAQEAAEARRSGTAWPPLQEIITAGEQLRMTPDLIAWLEALSNCRLHNHYGPSETHVTTAWTLEGDPRRAPALPPIGKPVANHRAFVLDGRLRPAPCGVVGELLLGGVGLARGYLGRPALTAERFVPDPFSGTSGARLYRTGDQARWLPAGALEFLGRLDEQVKVRGYRVEPGEIEAVLAEQPGVAEAVAVVREDRPGVKRLVAYLVTAGAGVDLDHVRQGLRDRLPEFMVPSAFVTLQSLPLTPSGKVDRLRLPALEAAPSGLSQPKTAMERALARIWTELLPVQEIGPEDHFFELGGHSLVAARVTARLRQRFGLDLPVRALFDYPVLRDLATRLETERAPELPEQVPGISKNAPMRAPLSWAQKRFFILDYMEPDSPSYVLTNAFKFDGRLEPAALRQAVTEVVRRHEILRTVYSLEQDEPVQTVVPAEETEVDLPVVDLSVDDSPGEDLWTALARRGAARSLKLSTTPLLRTTLFRLAPDRYVFALDVHHMACDGWGLGVLLDEISALYTPSGKATVPVLAPVPLQYSAYAAWEQGLDRKDEASALTYWRGHLSGAPQVLELPLDRLRPAFAAHSSGIVEAVLTPVLTLDLRRLARSGDASLFMVVLVAFGWLLARLSGQRDLLLAVPVANRRRPELEGLVGCFMNVVVPRLSLAGERSAGENLEQVRETTLAALQHSQLPLERLLEELKPQRQSNRNPLFQVLFQVLNTPSSPLSLGGLRGAHRLVESGTSRVDLELTVVEEGETLRALFGYDQDLFDTTTVLRWSHHLEALLEQIAADPRQPLEFLVAASAAERHQVRVEWNDTASPLPPRLLHELFEAQVARTPDAIAVVDRERTLTYAQLNTKANRLARLLASLGVQPGDPVAVLVGRTGLLPVTLLGILKAGAFYLPLDLTYPEERNVFMLEDACGGDSSVLVLVDETLRGDLDMVSEFARIQYINLGDPEQGQGNDPGNPGLPVGLLQTAYLLYTSGSTGRPKGVQISHGAVVNLVEALTRWPGIGPEDTVLAVITAAFDMSVPEIFWPLSRGARVVIAERAVASDGRRLATALEEYGATILQATPATWRLLVQAGWEGDGRLKAITGGEALTADLSRQLLCAAGEVWNLYGPTEVTVYCSGTRYIGGPVTVGKPVANTAVHVLDTELREAPMGVPGEAFVSGAGLATGYFRRPALTAERFVPDPFLSRGAGSRMYHTGDVARWRPDGRLELMGRTDFQVKIHGFRIELGEIETVLADHPAVTQAAVLAREDRPGDRRLVAYLLLTPGQGQPSFGGFQAFLRRSLPGYMVPSSYVVMDVMPLTPNEKLDRQALPAPEGRALGREDDGVAPRTPTEAWVAEIFAGLVGAERVGPFDDFFALGGHSLLALHVITRVREKGGVDLPLATLFRASTVEKLAAVIDGEVGISSSAAVLLGASATERPPFFCCHGVGGNVFRMMPLALEVAKDRAFYGLQGWADLHDVDHMSSVEQMAARYVAEMRQVQPRGPYYLGGHSLGCIVAFEIARLLTGEGHEVAFLGLLDGPANPGKAAPSKAALRSFNHEAHLALELGVEIDRRAFDRISKEKRLEIVVEKGIASNALPVGFTAADARRYLEVYRITQEAWMRYRPASWGGRATFFSTKSANPKVRALDPTDGWGEVALGGVEVINVPGDHNTMLRRPHVETLAAEFLRVMKKAEKEPMSLVEVPAKRGFGVLLSKLGLRRLGSSRRS